MSETMVVKQVKITDETDRARVKTRVQALSSLVTGELLDSYQHSINIGRPPILPAEIHNHPVYVNQDQATYPLCSNDCLWVDQVKPSQEAKPEQEAEDE